MRIFKTLAIVTVLFLSSCSEYWWTRGQPPGVGDLIKRSESKLDESLSTYGTVRPSLASAASEVRTGLREALTQMETEDTNNDLISKIDFAQQKFMQLEGILSIGSRAAYGELSGQLRRFKASIDSGDSPDPKAFGLFTARTMFFLANELTVPAPNFG